MDQTLKPNLNPSLDTPPPLETRAHPVWTPKETEVLKTLLSQNTSLAKMASTLGKTEKAIRRKCERLNISCSPKYKKHI
jgi:hypothetical protein